MVLNFCSGVATSKRTCVNRCISYFVEHCGKVSTLSDLIKKEGAAPVIIIQDGELPKLTLPILWAPTCFRPSTLMPVHRVLSKKTLRTWQWTDPSSQQKWKSFHHTLVFRADILNSNGTSHSMRPAGVCAYRDFNFPRVPSKQDHTTWHVFHFRWGLNKDKRLQNSIERL